MLHKLFKIYLSWFGSGYAPKAPGTFGTLASLPFIYAWSLLQPSHIVNFILIIIMTVMAIFTAEIIQQAARSHDPQWIVIDEVIGMLITWSFVRPSSALEWILCFAAFRLLDIFKIWPASYFDKKIKHGAGTILDDVVSGVYAGVFVLTISHYFLRT